MKLTMAVPTFTGFYETLHSAAIDDEVEQSVAGDDDRLDEEDEQVVEAMNAFHYTNGMLSEYAKSYVLRWNEYIQNETGFDPKAEFTELWSPREYNFETDRIFVKVPEETIWYMIKAMDRKAWAALIKERLSPRPGFAPFYSNDVRSSDWDLTQYRDWGPAKLELLCEAWMRSFDLIDKGMNWTEAEIISAMESNGEVHNAVLNNAPEKWVELVNQIDARREQTEG